MNNRYSRQSLVPEFGPAGQQRLTNARVLIVGAGGLGCTVAAQLAGAGVGSLCIVDYDNVDISNLHRQILFRESDIGENKAVVAAREAKRINTECSIDALETRLSTSNVEALVAKADIVVDAADNFASSYMLSDACLAHSSLAPSKALISASVNRTFGYVGQFCYKSPSLRAVFPRLPQVQANCDTVGVTGPSVGVIASIQAQETLKAILDDPSQLRGKLLYLDAWNYSQQLIDFNDSKEPQGNIVKLISASEVDGKQCVIDVRDNNETLQSPLQFAGTAPSEIALIPLTDINMVETRYRVDTPIVCACRSGQRAITAAQTLLDQGFTDVSALIPE